MGIGVALIRANVASVVKVDVEDVGWMFLESSRRFESRPHYAEAVQEYLSDTATAVEVEHDGTVHAGAFFVQRAIVEQAGSGQWFHTRRLHTSANGVRCPLFFLVDKHMITAMAAPAWYPDRAVS